ncbi:haloacid dehalogenase [Catellatospora methionotrophica]|uniref:Haloacid dehalogenase n=1 Tax=Catellatospora methionotrophica TaxID=121620 RepID=A0A8J3LEV4_9ACTN|nr:haloacid dehalogenase-like hydrolase [Catellatospora methionotrophica]GIG17075.1 haloacid dehalogenase [Catellatospora methionotrophica]
MQRLVLWDIDRTLIDGGKVGRDVFVAAYLAVVGSEPPRLPEFGGRTDHWLFTTALEWHGREADADIRAAFFAHLAEHTRASRPQLVARGAALTGAAQALAALAGQTGVVQSVVTGNIREAAYEKLSAFDLLGQIDLEVGGYGCDDGVRSVLVRLAHERAQAKYAATVPARQVVVIGDTPHDIEAARANGALAIGVATGSCTFDELVEAGADVVLPSLADTAAVLRAALG